MKTAYSKKVNPIQFHRATNFGSVGGYAEIVIVSGIARSPRVGFSKYEIQLFERANFFVGSIEISAEKAGREPRRCFERFEPGVWEPYFSVAVVEESEEDWERSRLSVGFLGRTLRFFSWRVVQSSGGHMVCALVFACMQACMHTCLCDGSTGCLADCLAASQAGRLDR